jgi:hypothetical protein
MIKIPEDGKLIDAGQLYKFADGECKRAKTKHIDGEIVRFATTIRDIIGELAYELPAVNAKPVIHGKWIEDYEIFYDDAGKQSYPTMTGWVCSECDSDGIPSWRYCKNCGAEMEHC